MLSSHAVFGVLEAVITVAVVALLGGLKRPEGASLRLSPVRSASIVGLAIAIAVLSAPQFGLASSSPDGYEAAVARAHDAGSSLGKLESAAATGELNARVQVWQDSLVAEFPASEAARGIIGRRRCRRDRTGIGRRMLSTQRPRNVVAESGGRESFLAGRFPIIKALWPEKTPDPFGVAS